MENDNKDNRKEFEEFGEVVKDSYLLALGLIQSFVSNGNNSSNNMIDYISSYGEIAKNPQLVIGSVLSHTKFIIDICAESMGLEEEEMMQHYAYHFYANVLPDIEALFGSNLDSKSYDQVMELIRDTGLDSVFNIDTNEVEEESNE
jgi:hypothetical protein